MTPLEGFLTTWSRALRTFGDGVPTPGSQIDDSSILLGLKDEVESADPGDHWRGGAATDYTEANAEHRRVLEKLADLDARLAVEIDESARVVLSGRAELDDVHNWVVGAASVPDETPARIMVLSIVSQALGRLDAIVSKAHAELNAIGSRIEQIGAEYAELSSRHP